MNTREWNEDAWERFFRREDARMAKFKELYDTLARDPARECMILREMGLQEIVPACEKASGQCERCAAHEDCELFEVRRLFEWPDHFDSDPESRDLLHSFEEVKQLPAYQKAHVFASVLQHYFRPLWTSPVADRAPAAVPCPPTQREKVWLLLDIAALVPAQVAGGHGIGYEPDCICGNIANCKRALDNARRCEQLVRDLALPPGDARTLIGYIEEVCSTLTQWIEDLRARAARLP